MYADTFVEITLEEALELIDNGERGINKYFNRPECEVDKTKATTKKVIAETVGRSYICRYTIYTVDWKLYLNEYEVDSSD